MDFRLLHLIATAIDARGPQPSQRPGHPPTETIRVVAALRRRDLCRAFGAEPRIHKRGRPRGSGLGMWRWPVERSLAWILENRRLALRYDRLGFVVQSLLQAACIFLVAGRLARGF